MNKFARFLKTPPKKRVASALRGFGFTNASAARGLGYVRTSATVTRLLQEQGKITAEEAKAMIQAPVLLAAPKVVTATPTVYSPNVVSFDKNKGLNRPKAAPAPVEPAKQEPAKQEPAEQEQEQESDPEFAEGRVEDFLPPADTEEGEPAWPQDSGGGDPGGGGQKKVGIKKSAQTSGGLMAQIKALPMPVKVIGGVAIAYVVWKVLE